MAPGDPVLARFSSSTSHDGFFEEDGAIWAPDGTLLAQSRQLALLIPGA
jgi:acyl-CoA thioesterase